MKSWRLAKIWRTCKLNVVMTMVCDVGHRKLAKNKIPVSLLKSLQSSLADESCVTSHQYSSMDSRTLRAWICSAVCLCSGSKVEPNWLAAHIRDADFSPRSWLKSSCIVAKGAWSLRPFTCPMSNSKNSPHFNLQMNETFNHWESRLITTLVICIMQLMPKDMGIYILVCSWL